MLISLLTRHFPTLMGTSYHPLLLKSKILGLRGVVWFLALGLGTVNINVQPPWAILDVRFTMLPDLSGEKALINLSRE